MRIHPGRASLLAMTTALSALTSGSLPAIPPAPPPGRGDGQTLEFARVLGTSNRGLAGSAEASPEIKAREAAQEIVSMTLVQPLLKLARESNSAAPPFGPGKGEQTFSGLLDATYAQEIVRAAQFPLVDRLARDMLSRSSPPGAEPGVAANDAGNGAWTAPLGMGRDARFTEPASGTAPETAPRSALGMEP